MPKPDPSQAAAYANHPEAAFPPRLSDLPKQAVPAHLAAAARLERLTAELQAAKSAAKATARAAREQQARIVGAALLMALANHPDTAFRQQLVDWLRRTVTKPADRAVIASLLIPLEVPSPQDPASHNRHEKGFQP